jgi:hypothetical protein
MFTQRSQIGNYLPCRLEQRLLFASLIANTFVNVLNLQQAGGHGMLQGRILHIRPLLPVGVVPGR